MSVVILHVVLCGYETWSLTVMEECSLKVSENRILRKCQEEGENYTIQFNSLFLM
jgi:hypothetical protein